MNGVKNVDQFIANLSKYLENTEMFLTFLTICVLGLLFFIFIDFFEKKEREEKASNVSFYVEFGVLFVLIATIVKIGFYHKSLEERLFYAKNHKQEMQKKILEYRIKKAKNEGEVLNIKLEQLNEFLNKVNERENKLELKIKEINKLIDNNKKLLTKIKKENSKKEQKLIEKNTLMLKKIKQNLENYLIKIKEQKNKIQKQVEKTKNYLSLYETAQKSAKLIKETGMLNSKNKTQQELLKIQEFEIDKITRETEKELLKNNELLKLNQELDKIR